MDTKPAVGSVTWMDLTVPDAPRIKDFYSRVVGWGDTPIEPVTENGWCMLPAGSDKPVAGICYAQGEIANFPRQWLIYITVDNIEESARQCVELGGKILIPVRAMGGGKICVFQDPAGAVAALYEIDSSSGATSTNA